MEIISKVLDKEYKIVIGRNILKDINKYYVLPNKVMIIYDEGVSVDYLDLLTSNILGEVYVFASLAEKSKNIETYSAIIRQLIKNEFSRSDLIIALGGGATCDLAGFVASSYKRGINLILSPTTTLSMVDASIGGKNAIDFSGIKNSVGSFYLPKLVLIDLDTLSSLDKKIYNEGLVEAVKMGLIKDKSLFDLFFGDINKNIEEIIIKSINAKNSFVERDFYDKGVRKYLNFGHTLAHALEAYTNYEVSHASAVAFGIIKLLKGDLKKNTKEIFDKLEVRYEFDVDLGELIKFIKQDKKIEDDYLDFVLVEEIEKPFIKRVKIEEIKF